MIVDPVTTGVLSSLLASVITLVASAGIRRTVIPFFRKRSNPLHSLFPFIVTPTSPLYVVYATIPRTGIAGEPFTVQQGDYLSIIKLTELLSELYGVDNLIFQESRSFVRNSKEVQNILLVSGPKWNRLTEYYLGKLGSPVTFIRNPAAIKVNVPGAISSEQFTTIRTGRDVATQCHGVILSGRVSSQYGLQNVVICAGRTTISTGACVMFLRALRQNRSKSHLVRAHIEKSAHKWGIVLKVETRRAGDEILLRPLDDDDVNISILRLFHGNEFVPAFEHKYD